MEDQLSPFPSLAGFLSGQTQQRRRQQQGGGRSLASYLAPEIPQSMHAGIGMGPNGPYWQPGQMIPEWGYGGLPGGSLTTGLSYNRMVPLPGSNRSMNIRDAVLGMLQEPGGQSGGIE